MKNLNSISGVRRALKYEIARQIDVVTSRRHDRAADAPLGRRQGRDDADAHEGKGARLPLFSRSRHPAGAHRSRPLREAQGPHARAARGEESAARASNSASAPTRRACSPPTRRSPIISRRRPSAKPANGAAVANFLLNDFLATATGDETLPKVAPEFFAELAELSASGQINSKQAKEVFAQDDRRRANRPPRW